MPGILWAVLPNPDSIWDDLGIIRRYPAGNPHHVTLQYNVEREPYERLIGREFAAIAVADCHNDRIQALSVAPPHWVPCQNEYPHIILSFCDGVAPVESNAMLANDPHCEIVGGLVSLRIEFLEWEKSNA